MRALSYDAKTTTTYIPEQKRRHTQIHDSESVDPTYSKVAIDTRAWLVHLAHADRTAAVPHTRRRLADVILRNAHAMSIVLMVPKKRGIIEIATYQDCLITPIFWSGSDPNLLLR